MTTQWITGTAAVRFSSRAIGVPADTVADAFERQHEGGIQIRPRLAAAKWNGPADVASVGGARPGRDRVSGPFSLVTSAGVRPAAIPRRGRPAS
jgi:hypothetical protein